MGRNSGISLELDESTITSTNSSIFLRSTLHLEEGEKPVQFKRKKSRDMGRDFNWSRSMAALPKVELTTESKALLYQDPESSTLDRRRQYEKYRDYRRLRERTQRKLRARAWIWWGALILTILALRGLG